MKALPEGLRKLAAAFTRLPGIGPKSAQRLSFYLVTSGREDALRLREALSEALSEITTCKSCFGLAERGEVCEICASPNRSERLICVVETVQDQLALERTGAFEGRYHILGGVISPLDGVGPEDLHVAELFKRVRDLKGAEVILALSPTPEGDATSRYLAEELKSLGAKVTRISRGVPPGIELQYVDERTLGESLERRTPL